MDSFTTSSGSIEVNPRWLRRSLSMDSTSMMTPSLAGARHHIYMAKDGDSASDDDGPQTPEATQSAIRTAVLQAVTTIRHDAPHNATVAPGPNGDLDFVTLRKSARS